MLALAGAWLGLIVCGLSLTMVVYRPAFNDAMVPAVLYGAAAAIGCGGLVLMRRPQPGNADEAVAAQKFQARVGIGLAMFAVLTTYLLVKCATPVYGAAVR